MSENSAPKFLTAARPSAGLIDLLTSCCSVVKNITDSLFSNSGSCRRASDYVKINWLTEVVKSVL